MPMARMIMKRFCFKSALGSLLLLALSVCSANLYATTPEGSKKLSFKERMNPDVVTLQYAGGIGGVSVGMGWERCKKRSLTELLVGYVPHYHNTQSLTTLTLRQYYTPWEVEIPLPSAYKGALKLRPLTVGAYINTVLFDGDFWTQEPTSHYGGDYYRFTTRVRFALSLGQRLTYEFPEEWKHLGEAAELFYDFSANELSIISAVPNKRITLADILSLGIGARWKF